MENSLKAWRPRVMLISVTIVAVVVAAAYLGDLVLSHGRYALLGVVGAVFANATGAGGGVVFIPVFSQLGFTEGQSVATSFGIQCFGMTAGAITWYIHYRHGRSDLHLWHAFWPIIGATATGAVIGIWSVYGLGLPAPASLRVMFAAFSLLLGLAILYTLFAVTPGHERSHPEPVDWIAFVVIGVGGGMVTGWLSVAVGEFLAFYLILRRFDVTLAVATAVVVTAITVWSAIGQHAVRAPQIYWEVVAFAGPGAVIGGILARRLVAALSARRLKLFFSSWLLLIGTIGLLRWWLQP